jgi:hypothetical protein
VVRWYRKAISQGCHVAGFNLDMVLLKGGAGVAKDKAGLGTDQGRSRSRRARGEAEAERPVLAAA